MFSLQTVKDSQYIIRGNSFLKTPHTTTPVGEVGIYMTQSLANAKEYQTYLKQIGVITEIVRTPEAAYHI